MREYPPKSFLSDTETNPKQCMDVPLRSGKELEEPKKNSNEEEQPENKKEEAEIKEKMEAKTEYGEVKVNTRGEKQKSDQVVPGRITFLITLPYTLHPYPSPKNSEKPS